jgi:molybdopterin synthase sulfur carrier subunit
MAKLRILYFAWLRERVGHSEEEVALPQGIATLRELIAWLRARHAGYEAAFTEPRLVRAAINQEFAGPDAAVADGDEVAFFPPITGG